MTDTADTSAKDAHYARLRRAHRDARRDAPGKGGAHGDDDGPVRIYGLHAVAAVLANPARRVHRLMATRNALTRLEIAPEVSARIQVETVEPKALDTLLGPDAVHQGVVAEVDALPRRRLSDLGRARLVVVLDQVTDPHNVGAILRSAAAFDVDALITTSRHAARESGVLAKAASGALERVPTITVTNLADAIETLKTQGFRTVGLDSEAPDSLADGLSADKLAVVLGAEGKGLRQKTRETVDRLVRLDMPGAIRSLNVSNAAAIVLYAANEARKPA